MNPSSTSRSLEAAIVRNPLVMSPQKTVTEAIIAMSQMRSQCNTRKTNINLLEELHLEARSSCVLIVENEKLLGILTERDIVCLCTQRRSLNTLALQEVMTASIIAIQESEFVDLFATINLFQDHQIRHLPVLDQDKRLVGLVTHETLRHVSLPIDLLRLRLAKEVMIQDVVCASRDTSMLAIAHRLVKHRVSSIIIVDYLDLGNRTERIPIGIITERDIVQLQALGLDLENYLAESIMSTPVFTISPEQSLLDVQQLMEQYLIRRVVVTGEQGTLLGIITQTTVLQILNPIEIYKLVNLLEQKVIALEREKLLLLENQTHDLQQQIEAQSVELRKSEDRYAKLTAEQEAQFQKLAMTLPGMLYVFVQRPDGSITFNYINSKVTKILELEVDAVLADSSLVFNLFHPDDVEGYDTAVAQSLATGEPFHHEWRMITPSGKVKWLEANSTPEIFPNSDILWFGVALDVTQRKQAELSLERLNTELEIRVAQRTAELIKANQNIQAMLDAFPDLLFYLNADGEILDYKTGNENLLYLPPSAFIGRNFQSVLPEELSQRMYQAFQQALSSGTTVSVEYVLPVREESRYFEARMIAKDRNNIIVVTRDITARKQAELEKHLLKERLEFLLERNPAVLYSCHTKPPYSPTFISPNIEGILGYSAQQVLQTESFWFERIHPDDYQQIAPSLATLGENGKRISEYRFLHQQGYYVWLRDEVRLVQDERGNPLEFIGYIINISDRKLAEENRKRQMAAIEAAIDGIGILQDGKYIYVNEAHVKMFGYEEPEELLGESWHKLYSPSEITRIEETVFPVLTRDHHWQGEMIATRKNGSRFDEGLSLTITDDGLLICVCRDISDRKEAEAQLQRTNQQLIRATRLKDEFLANMSHELRTPLNAILGMTEGLKEQVFGELNEKQHKSLNTIENSANHLLSLINDILDVAKIESGQIELESCPVAISSLCASSLAFIKQQAFKKQIQVETQIPDNLPNLILDERRIRQVLINLLTNAVKFTPEGGQITMTAALVPHTVADTQQIFLHIAITDTGIGIASENLDRLFKPFVQIDSALNRQYTGTGLGLALVKQIVELHGGQVQVTSQLGHGSCFTVELPCVASRSDYFSSNLDSVTSQMSSTAATPFPNFSPLVLLAEDNQANTAMVTDYLETKGYRLLFANNGREAIAVAQSQQPDIILMDIQMPEMDGLEAIKYIRQDPDLTQIPIIALTALAMDGDRDRCLAAGANEYLSKPVRLKQLDITIRRLLNNL
ncbi:MAG: PAS domain-containing protein [Snowella sp.]|nr:PAS domain-containing protein [Snowella sp.]